MEDMTPRKAVEFAIETEAIGAKVYQHLARKCRGDEEIAKIFTRLSKYFQSLLEKVPQEAAKGYGEKYGLLRAMSISEFFSTRDGLEKDMDAISGRDDALKRAFGLEKATIGYYQELKEVLEDGSVLDEIIAAEKEHLLAVMKYMVTGAKFRGLGDKF